MFKEERMFAVINEDNTLFCYLDSEPTKGETFLTLTMEEWQDALSINADSVVDGKLVSLIESVPLTGDNALTARKWAYKEESDPLFMEWQYDGTEESKEIWRNSVQSIKERFPL